MSMRRDLSCWCSIGVLVALPGLAHAQPAPALPALPAATPAAVPASTPASASTGMSTGVPFGADHGASTGTAASAALGARPEVVTRPAAGTAGIASAPASAPASAAARAPARTAAAPSCSAATDEAMAADLKAATAQSQRGEVSVLARLFDESIALWRRAVQWCGGRAKERAERNLADSRQERGAISELQGAGEKCGAGHKDAAALQDLALRATTERRWRDAAVLYRKAENMWDLAAERCSGAQQQTALQRREQAATDAHNAEFCAPGFDRAREHTQHLRQSGAALSPADRQTQLQIAETLWREAIPQCKGAALDLVRSNAQTLARERGTPWVATQPVPPPVLAVHGAAAASAPAAAPGAAVPAEPARRAEAVVKSGSGPLDRTPSAGAVAPVAAAPKTLDIVVGAGTRFIGQFVADPGGMTYTGSGRIVWPNGDKYDGALLHGQRHGHGEFIWVNGQRYSGDWVGDRPDGRGTLRFANGNLFEGNVVGGVPHGNGKMIYASGDVYTGAFTRGEPDGYGVYLWISGQRYEGPWLKGKAVGQGTMRFANGNRYEGALVDGIPQGAGRMVYASGDTYSGDFVDGVPHGQGSYRWKNGDQYSGQWQAGTKEGRGTLVWSDGDRWVGLFHADAQTDDGELVSRKP